MAKSRQEEEAKTQFFAGEDDDRTILRFLAVLSRVGEYPENQSQ